MSMMSVSITATSILLLAQDTPGLAPTSVRRRTVQRVGNEVSVTLDSGPRDNAGNVSINSRENLLITDTDEFSYGRTREKGVDALLIEPNTDDVLKRQRINMAICKYLEGAAWGNDTIVEAMRRAPFLQLRDKTEIIDGHRTYVLQAQDKQDTFVLWIDPENGFNPRRIEMLRSRDGKADSSEILRHLVMDNIGIEQIDGKYIIMSASITYKREDPDGGPQEMNYRYSVKRTNVRFNADFSRAVKEFWEGVPHGTPVYYTDERGARRVAYEWHKGQVRPKIDGTFVKESDKSIDVAQTDASMQVADGIASPGKEEHPDTPDAGPRGTEGQRATSEPHRQPMPLGLAVASLIGLGIVGLGVWGFVKHRRAG
jgi:hypothetical protein